MTVSGALESSARANLSPSEMCIDTTFIGRDGTKICERPRKSSISSGKKVAAMSPDDKRRRKSRRFMTFLSRLVSEI